MTKPQNKYRIKYLITVALLILNLFFIYLLKYRNQELPISEFSFNTGNMINLVFFSLLVAGILVLIFKREVKEFTRTITALIIITNILLVLSAVITFIKLPLPEYYLFEYHISRVIVGFIFGMYQFMLLVFLSAVWFFIFGYKKYLFFRTVLNSLFLLILLFLFSVIYLNMNNRSSDLDHEAKNNIGVVLGAAVWSNKPSPSLSSRADKAAHLLAEGKIDGIQLTGSNAPGELSEAEMAYNYLNSKNINMNKVYIESHTTSTNEQIRFIKSHLYNKDGVDDVIIISDGYHLTRVKEICWFHNMDVKVMASDLVHSFRDKLYYNFREAAGIVIFWLFAL